jgi:hypothetical protein
MVARVIEREREREEERETALIVGRLRRLTLSYFLIRIVKASLIGTSADSDKCLERLLCSTLLVVPVEPLTRHNSNSTEDHGRFSAWHETCRHTLQRSVTMTDIVGPVLSTQSHSSHRVSGRKQFYR